MKKFALLVLLALVSVLPSHATNTLIGGTWKDGAGVLINGSITAQLAVTALDGSTSQTVTTRPVSFRLLNGAIQPGAYLVDTINMQPQNDYYVVTVTDESGFIISRGNYVIPAVAGGTTYSLAAAVPTVLTTSSVYYPQVNIFTGTPSTVNPNFVLVGPTVGPAAIPTFRALVGADLPLPTAGTLGGVQSKAAAAHNFLTQISTAGVVSQARPVFADFGDTNAGVTCLNALTYNSATTTWGCNVTAGTGTVTSVALTAPAIFAVGGSPVVASGTLALTLANQSANQIWSGPTTGGAAAPTFRTLVAADIPTLDASTKLNGNLPTARLNSGNNASSGTFWRGDGVWSNGVSGDFGVGNDLFVSGATNLNTLLTNGDGQVNGTFTTSGIVLTSAVIDISAQGTLSLVNGVYGNLGAVMSNNVIRMIWNGTCIQLFVDLSPKACI